MKTVLLVVVIATLIAMSRNDEVWTLLFGISLLISLLIFAC